MYPFRNFLLHKIKNNQIQLIILNKNSANGFREDIKINIID